MIFLQLPEELSSPEITNQLERAAAQALKHVAAPDADLSLVFSDDEQLRQLNLQFRGVDAPTDVLSFFDGSVDPETGRTYLGDILISIPRAQAQAAAGGHTLTDELQLLIVHGVLHLLGYDHTEPDDKNRMWPLQAEILTQLACPIHPPD